LRQPSPSACCWPPKRIYVTGLSMGGGAAWTLATASVAGSSPTTSWASQIAALVPIAGAADPKGANSGICNAMVAANLPVFAFHGTAHTRLIAGHWREQRRGRGVWGAPDGAVIIPGGMLTALRHLLS
jgi:dienelactone hydrolase